VKRATAKAKSAVSTSDSSANVPRAKTSSPSTAPSHGRLGVDPVASSPPPKDHDLTTAAVAGLQPESRKPKARERRIAIVPHAEPDALPLGRPSTCTRPVLSPSDGHEQECSTGREGGCGTKLDVVDKISGTARGVQDQGGRPPEGRTETEESPQTIPSSEGVGPAAPSVHPGTVCPGAGRTGARGSQRSALGQAIYDECNKRIARQQAKERRRRLSQRDFARRTKTPFRTRSSTTTSRPPHPHYDPDHVLPRVDSIAHAVEKAIREGTYQPVPAVDFEVPKPGGGTRTVTWFSIVDAAVSKWLLTRLSKRHAHELSTYAYGFRTDRGIVHAIENIAREVRAHEGVFVAEYDFLSFFDNIGHDHLFKVLDEIFRLGPRDLKLVKTIVKTPRAASWDDFRTGKSYVPDKGIPQGSAVSLFLANAACWALDRELEGSGAVFSRFGDDVCAVGTTLKVAKRVRKAMRKQAARAGTPINVEKSPGIRFYGDRPPKGVAVVDAIDFVGHRITKHGVAIAAKSLKKILTKIDLVIFLHLLHGPQQGTLPKTWSIDDEREELVGLMSELRSYIYGRGVWEKELRDALESGEPTVPARGIIARYPAVDHGGEEMLRAIDRHMVEALTKAHWARVRIFREHGLNLPVITRQGFARGQWLVGFNKARTPSALLAWRYARLARRAGLPVRGGYGGDDNYDDESGHEGSD
jgi:hypothetical protein